MNSYLCYYKINYFKTLSSRVRNIKKVQFLNEYEPRNKVVNFMS